MKIHFNILSNIWILLILIVIIHHRSVQSEFQSKRILMRENQEARVQADFSIKLLQNSIETTDAIVISPFSVGVILALVYAGSGGNTREQIQKALAHGLSDDDLHQYYSQNNDKSEINSSGYVLRTANRAYIHDTYEVKRTYLDFIRNKYSSDLIQIDFSDQAALVKDVNDYIDDKTYGEVKEVISIDSIDSEAVLMFVNAIFFKGDWKIKFDETLTKPRIFYANEKTKREVYMMEMINTFKYGRYDGGQILGLPYVDESIFMYIFLPKNQFGLDKLLEEANGDWLLDNLVKCHNVKVEVKIPKFKIEKSLKLKETLIKMGLAEAFTYKADFSKISENIFISNLHHKAVIEVNEEGSSASAATVAEFIYRSAMRNPKFIADHPFLFFIVKDNQRILFIGKYN